AGLDRIRLRLLELKKDRSGTKDEDALYAEAFRRYGLDVDSLPVAEAARRGRAAVVRMALLAAPGGWAWSREIMSRERARLYAVADGADDSPWRRRLREAFRRWDRARLKELAGDAQAFEQPPAVQSLLGAGLRLAGLSGEARDFLRQAQRRHP